MGQCLFCEKDAGVDKRGRTRTCCSMKCVVAYSAKKRSLKEKECIGCKIKYTPKYMSKQKFCTMKCKAKFHWENGRCRVPLEISLKNLRSIPYEGKDKLYGNNRYKRYGKEGIKEHRLVMQNHLGRKLESHEHVHHINGDPKDNRIENLQVVTASEHMKIHYTERNLD